jgi:hypothetical protein
MNRLLFFALVVSTILFANCSNAKQQEDVNAADTESAADSEEAKDADSEAEPVKRSDYTFTATYHIDKEEDLVDSIHVVGNLKDGTVAFDEGVRLITMQEASSDRKWFEETDVNFDGIPDLLIYTGYWGFGGQGGDIHTCYVWDEKNHRFVYVEDFTQIPDPSFEADTKTIRADYRAEYDLYVHAVYKWEGFKLKQVSYETEGIEDFYGDTEEEE